MEVASLDVLSLAEIALLDEARHPREDIDVAAK